MMMLSVVDPVGTKGQKREGFREECTVARFVGEWERANLVVQLARFVFCLYVALP